MDNIILDDVKDDDTPKNTPDDTSDDMRNDNPKSTPGDIHDDKNDPEEDAVKEKINRDRKRQTNQRSKTPPCRRRIDVLSTPNRRLILDLYQRHAYHLSKERVERIQELLQVLYAMTPEETQKYFMELELENNRKRKRRRIKDILREQYVWQKRQQDIAKAYRTFANFLEKGIRFAVTHAIPPLVSVRLRYLSDIVLEQICDLRNVSKPDREDCHREGLFLLAVADWIAVGIEQVYYDVQVQKKEKLKKLEQEKEKFENTKTPAQPQETADSKSISK